MINPNGVMTSVVKKSHAAIISWWFLMKFDHVVSLLRFGIGGIPFLLRIFPIVWSLTLYPRFDKAPTIQPYPQLGLSSTN